MIENMNDFLSVALLVGFFIAVLLYGFNALNKKRVRKHIEEEYYYYNDTEEVDDDKG